MSFHHKDLLKMIVLLIWCICHCLWKTESLWFEDSPPLPFCLPWCLSPASEQETAYCPGFSSMSYLVLCCPCWGVCSCFLLVCPVFSVLSISEAHALCTLFRTRGLSLSPGLSPWPCISQGIPPALPTPVWGFAFWLLGKVSVAMIKDPLTLDLFTSCFSTQIIEIRDEWFQGLCMKGTVKEENHYESLHDIFILELRFLPSLEGEIREGLHTVILIIKLREVKSCKYVSWDLRQWLLHRFH